MQFDWRAISGPALTTATALIAFFVDRHFVAVPNPAPLFVCIVAFASSLSGLASGMISAVIAVVSSALFFLNHRATPGYDSAARETLAGKKNLRLMQMGPAQREKGTVWDLKRISGGILVQEPDTLTITEADLKVVTKRQPSREELRDLLFGWKVAKHVKSNAIVFARGGRTLGVGAGQMSRVDSVKIAVLKAQESLAGSAVASDAFFPFPDGVEEAGRAGATSVIQPGGSVRDEEVIAAADRLGMAMVFTGVRHFRH